MLITKADGSIEEFDAKKLRQSLSRSGAPETEINTIVYNIESIVSEGMSTQEIYRRAFAMLKGAQASVTARYSLRRALFGLGPTGFPFESFLARLFESQGYNTKTGIIIPGRCAEHEIDLAAYKEDHSFVAEAKFHQRPGLKSDLQVAMYSYARMLDLSEVKICSEDICGVKNLKIITNTKFTTAAIRYGNCVGIELLGWDYPKEGNLFNLIEKTKLYPITVLQSLNKAQKNALLEIGIVVCKEIIERQEEVSKLGVSARKMEALLSEVRQLSPSQQG